MQVTHRFSISSRLSYQLVQKGWLLLNIAVIRGTNQRVLKESLTNNVNLPLKEQTGPDGVTRFHGIASNAGLLEIDYQAEVERVVHLEEEAFPTPEVALVDLPGAVTPFLYPSRYCESDKLQRFAAKQFSNITPGHERVAGVCNWIYDNIDYIPGATDEHTSAVDCLTLRAGVCRDFAHLGVALCRALGIPARYGSAYAYLLPQPDYHAFFEVWLGRRWWYYDATRLAPQHGFVQVGRGHDAADTSVATMSGGVQFQNMAIDVQKLSTEVVEHAKGPISFFDHMEY